MKRLPNTHSQPSLSSAPVAHDVAAVVALVRHHDDDGVAGHVIQPVHDGAAEAVRPGIPDRRQLGNRARAVAQGSARSHQCCHRRRR